MLLELRRDIQAIAIDPSDVAFHYISTRFRNEPRVTTLRCSILDYKLDGPAFPAVISVGASHHMDTAQFFRSIYSCLIPGGVLIIADEMISKFKTTTDRANALIVHHLQYIFDTLVTLPPGADPADRELAQLLKHRVPDSLILAHAGMTSQAVRSVRETLSEASKLNTPTKASHPLAAFSRFHLLEFQALVAGLDYEIEQKPTRFASGASRRVVVSFASTMHGSTRRLGMVSSMPAHTSL
jgi:SAM-dependent methyltransferase